MKIAPRESLTKDEQWREDALLTINKDKTESPHIKCGDSYLFLMFMKQQIKDLIQRVDALERELAFLF